MIHAPVHTLALYVLHTILCISAIGVCARPTIVTYPRSNTAVDTITPPPVRGILMEGRLIRSTPPNKQTSPTKFLVYFLVRYTYLLLQKLLYKINHTIHRDSIRFLVYSIIWSLGCHLTQLLSLHPVLIKAISILPMLKHLKHSISVPLLLLLCIPGAAALGEDAIMDTASTTISTFLLAALSKDDHRESAIDTSFSHTLTGDLDPPTTGFNTMTLNVRGGISTPAKWLMVCETALQHDPDVLVLTETGNDNSPGTLQWLTRKLRPRDTITTTNVHTQFNDLPYQIISSEGSVEGERGGIVTLIHNRWRHRRVGKVIHDTHKRWLALDIRTPLGRTTIIAAYMKHSPGSNPAILKEWDELIDFIVHRQIVKKRRVILLGDLNISRNTPQTRSVVANHCIQEEILHRLDSVGGLTDSFPHRHPDKQYCTYQQRNREGDVLSWSGIDHIMVSHQDAHRITSSTISNAPTVDSTLDHSLLYTRIAMTASPIAARVFTRPAFDIKRKAEYATLTEDTLDILTPPEDATELAHTLFTTCITSATKLFTRKRTATRSRPYVLRENNDLKALGVALQCLQHNTPIPHNIQRRKCMPEDASIDTVTTARKTIRDRLNSKSRKQAHVTRRMFISRRTGHFLANLMGPFLASALSITSHFKGIEGIHVPATDSVSMDADATKALATERISNTFFKPRIPVPNYMHSPSTASWLQLPQWFRHTFRAVKEPRTNPIFHNTLRTVTMHDLTSALRHLGRNKAGGPSGLTTEMLIHLSPATQEKWLLPYINACFKARDVPSHTKSFNVWCIEKEKGVGPIMHPTDKLQVRPISLFEVSVKLVEAVLASRIHNTMLNNNYMHESQHGFLPQRSVTNALLTYCLLTEDAHERRKEIHISNNDCTQAYDAVPPWAMRSIYKYHGFPPALIDMLCNMDTGRKGRVLTAHGAGTEWDMECGLGQGSVLAPLKWNLFLDPLLKRMDTTPDPYTFVANGITHEMRIAAFADDTTIVASTHAGYLARMEMATEYFSLFGVNFSPQKTHYTYAHTQGKHYASADIPVRAPDGTIHVTPSAVTPPQEPLRYLGGWLSPTGNWSPAKNKLKAEVHKILTVLKHKQLPLKQFQYTINSVLMAKLRRGSAPIVNSCF